MSALEKDWVGLQWRGAWSALTQYRVRDAVQYQGSSYVAGGSVAPTVGVAPTTSESGWDLLAAAGDGEGGGGVDWGQIGGDLEDQTDLQGALDAKADAGDVTASGLTMATARLLGRTTASAGAVEEITIGANLTLTGGELSASGDVVSAAAALTDARLVAGSGGGRGVAATSIDPANVVTAAANLTNNQLVRGNGTKGLATLAAGTNGHVLGMVSGSPAYRREREAQVYTVSVVATGTVPSAGAVQLVAGITGDTWEEVSDIVVSSTDLDGWRSDAWVLEGMYEEGFVLVDGGNGAWCVFAISTIAEEEGILSVTINELIAQGSVLNALDGTVRLTFFPPEPGVGTGDVVGPAGGTVANQVAVFSDTSGKLITNRATLTASASAVTIGDVTAATVTIGKSDGGGTTVNGSATFNGALLSPGAGTNSTKIGPSAAAAGNDGIAIGRSASAAGADAVAIGRSTVTTTGSENIAIGQGSTASGAQGRNLAIGFSASATGGDAYAIGRVAAASGPQSIAFGWGATASGADSIAIGRAVNASHNGAVAIGRSFAAGAAATSAAADDFVLGVAAHNYKLPGTIVTDLRFRTTTGTKIGTGTNQLIGFWNATPVAQPAAVADATDTTDVITRLNDLLSRLRTIGLIAST